MYISDEMLFKYAAQARNIWLSTLSKDDDIPEFQCSKSFEQKMQRLIKKQRQSSINNQISQHIKKLVVAVLAVVVIFFSGFMTVEAYREKVVGMVVQIFNELTNYHFSSSNITADEIMLPELTFEYIPTGMKEIDNRMTSNNRYYIMYEDSDGIFFELTQRPIAADGSYGTILDTENASYKIISINGIEAYSNSKDGNSSIAWILDNIVYNLYGNIDLNELRLIAENIKIINY